MVASRDFDFRLRDGDRSNDAVNDKNSRLRGRLRLGAKRTKEGFVLDGGRTMKVDYEDGELIPQFANGG